MTQKEVREQLELCEKAEPRDLRQLDQTDNIVRVNYPAILKQLDEAMEVRRKMHALYCPCSLDRPGIFYPGCVEADAVRAYFGETR